MKKIIKSALSVVVMTLLLVAALSPYLSVNAAKNTDPLSSIYFSPCAGYTRVWDAEYPCAGDLVIPAYVGFLPVTQIWTNALSYTDITSVIIPDTVTSLANGYNFDGCRKLKKAVLSDNIGTIPNNAFANCDVLETVDLGTGVTEIHCDAFVNCPKLEYIELPLSIKEIRRDAFHNGAFYLDGDGLQCAYYPGTIAQWNQVDVEDKTVLDNVLYVTRITGVKHSFDGIKVTAEKRPGAKTYTFYRQEKTGGKWGEWKKVKTVKTPSVTDTNAVKGHTYRYAVKAANGPYTTKLSVASKAITFAKVSTVKLSKNAYTYDGKLKTPVVTVKNSAGVVLKKGTDYTVSYSTGRKNVGAYKVTIKLKGKYSGQKILKFNINPGKVAISKLTSGANILTATWVPRTVQVTGYQIQYSTNKSFNGTKAVGITKSKVKTRTIKGLAKGKTYYVRIRTYKTVNGVKFYSAWSAAKTVRVK